MTRRLALTLGVLVLFFFLRLRGTKVLGGGGRITLTSSPRRASGTWT